MSGSRFISNPISIGYIHGRPNPVRAVSEIGCIATCYGRLGLAECFPWLRYTSVTGIVTIGIVNIISSRRCRGDGESTTVDSGSDEKADRDTYKRAEGPAHW